MTHTVFTRTFWRANTVWPDGKEPHLGRKRHIATVETEAEAQAIAQQWNRDNKPGKMSRKAEYQ
jgi:hypothetical protein